MVVQVDADAVCHAEWLVTGEDGCAGVAFFLSGVPVGCVALKLQVELSFLHFGFLQTEKVGIQQSECLAESFTLAGSQAVYVPRNEFHYSK
jgi:hypothetical protein